MDHIDLSVCRIFEIDHELYKSRLKKGRLVLARFMAIYIRHERGADRPTIAGLYRRDPSTISHAIETAANLLRHNKDFRDKYERCLRLIDEKKAPYTPELIRQGVKVWTRADSAEKVTEGTVITVLPETGQFTVGSFEDPGYHTVNRLEDGRLTATYETSRDIMYIEAP